MLVLTFRFALVAAISILAIALVLTLYIIPSLQQDIDRHHQRLSATVTSQVESYFSVADRELRSLSILIDSNVYRGSDINVLLDSYVNASKFYEAIYLIDAKGKVVSIGLPAEARRTRLNHIGLDFSHRDFVREARALNVPTWSNSFLSPISLRLAIAMAIPAGSQTLIGEVAISPMPAFARKLTSGSNLNVMILDRQNQLVADSGNRFLDQQLNLGHLPMIADVRSGKASAQVEFEFDLQRMVGSAWPVPGIDWLVVVSQPGNIAYEQLEAILFRFRLAFALAIVAAILAALWTGRSLSKRFLNYNIQAEHITHGNYDGLRWEESYIREFNALRDNLQVMAHSIESREAGMQQAQSELKELNATLESRVEERTDELTRSNEELVQTLETLQQAQNELLRAEKLASLGSMVAGIAHELNTPIGNSVMVASTLADHTRTFKHEVETGSVRRSTLDRHISSSDTALDILMRNLHRASELIKSFKQVAVDQTSAQRRQFLLDEVVGEITLALHPMLKKTPFTVKTFIDDNVLLDSFPGPLGQVLSNLINNAVIHGFEGRAQGEIEIYGRKSADHLVELIVTDNGCGISPKHIDKIFDPFFTTKLGKGGSGLGLNIVHSIVTRVLGGQVKVISASESGTRFEIVLPDCAPNNAKGIL